MTEPALTVVTVALAGHVPHVLANRRLQQQLSPEPVNWVVVDNDDGRVAQAVADSGVNGIVVVPGVSARDVPQGFGFGSYHHAAGLAVGLRACATRFLLVLDPDLYLVRPKWIRDVVKTMRDGGPAVFGVPWHPIWYGKYRHFPCVHCLFVDTARVPLRRLDFTPELRERPSRRLSASAVAGPPLATATTRAERGLRLVTSVPRVIYHLTIMRRQIGRTRDTGCRIHDALHSSCASDVADAVAVPADFAFPFHLRTTVGRRLERQLPERWSYLPRGYTTDRTFADLGVLDGRARGWEEFLWRGEPFALHVRRTKQGDMAPGADERIANEVLEAFSGVCQL